MVVSQPLPWRPSPLNSIDDDLAAVSRIDLIPKILDVVCKSTGMGFAAVARVTQDRWVACAVHDEIDFGLKPGGELEVSTTICDAIRDSGAAVVIDHVAEDAAYRDHPTPKMYGFQSYISVPIVCGGGFFGTLCAIDPRPNILSTPQTLGMVELFAELIASHLDAEQRWASSEAALLSAREAAELRDQFIAVLGHDLRNPLASIDGGARLLLKTPLDEKAATLVGMMQNSVRRMAGLIDDVLDFARGRLGGGFDIERRADPALGDALEQVVAELRVAHPERTILIDIGPDMSVESDSRRIAQLASNLLANALTHGAPGEPIRLSARKANDAFELSVSNLGEPILPEAMDRLFQPFSRASVRPNQQGLGLGLYIASEIARAHGGALCVTSDAAETRFTFTMPLAA
jgi:signal transduction histidine kinase